MLWSFFRCPFIQMCWTQCLLFVQNLKGLCLYCPMLWKAIWALGAAARYIWIKSVAPPECSSILTMPKKLFAASFLLLYQSWNLYFLFSNMKSSLGHALLNYKAQVLTWMWFQTQRFIKWKLVLNIWGNPFPCQTWELNLAQVCETQIQSGELDNLG